MMDEVPETRAMGRKAGERLRETREGRTEVQEEGAGRLTAKE